MYIDMRCSLLQFILCECEKARRRNGLKLFMTQTRVRKLMRGIGFLEYYCGSRKKKQNVKSGKECLNEDLKRPKRSESRINWNF